MAQSTKKQETRIRYSRKNPNGTYENLNPSERSKATAINVFRNDDTKKAFEEKVKAIAAKFSNEGFELDRQNDAYALLVRDFSQSASDVLGQ